MFKSLEGENPFIVVKQTYIFNQNILIVVEKQNRKYKWSFKEKYSIVVV